MCIAIQHRATQTRIISQTHTSLHPPKIKMLLTKSTRKAKKLLHKTLQTLTSFFSRGYQKLPKLTKNPTKNRFLENFPYEWEKKITMKEGQEEAEYVQIEEGFGQIIIPSKNNKQKKKALAISSREPSCCRDEMAMAMARKMKEVEMVNGAGDMEQDLDVEEAIHYYSRLKSPVYLDIVDNFFIDMYSELTVTVPHHHSTSICNSKRRKGSLRF